MRYELTRLGSAEFEHLSQALGIAVLGPAVSVFGAGPDGGREATWNGRVDPAPVPASECWDGAGVLQAKFKQTVTSTEADTRWLLSEIRKELKAWADDKSSRRQRVRLPQYLIFTTNVTLSPDPQRGGIDQVDALIKSYNDRLGLQGWAVWHQDQICRYLDVHDGVRRTYRALITPGDVLADVQDALARLRPDEVHTDPLGDLLARRAAKELSAQRWVRLHEAGHPTNQKLNLSDVAVDLPARPRDGDPDTRIPGIVAHLVRMGDEIRRPRRGHRPLPHIALVGGPGQGKTTLGQLLCQTYRTAILERRERHTLGLDVPDLLDAYRRHLTTLRIPVPRCPRWPVRVVLSEFADAIALDSSLTLMGYIAAQSRDVSPINKRMMREWLREWPWLLILDGLDEVADPDNREKALTAITDFQLDATSMEADLLVVATTRPQGYRDELPSRFYEHFDLDLMQTTNALEYSKHLVGVRFVDDPEMHDRVLARLRAAARDPQTARLMRTPLQVTIMSILLERRARAPRDRYGLFEAYYTTLYEREVAKGTSVARLLDDHRADVDVVHERIGLLLQQRAQHAGEAEARLPRKELRRVALERLLDEEHPKDEADRLAEAIARAATDRLVMLVGLAGDTVGFEVRSLQELMAARSLFHGGDEQLIGRLQAIAPSAHWRNTWLFAVSRVFTEREPLRDHVVAMLHWLDSDNPLSQALQPGARLATELLDEDLTVAQPKYRRLLLVHALDLLRTSYPGPTMTALARVTHEACSQDTTLLHTVLPAVEAGLRGRHRDQVAALDFLAAWEHLPGNASVTARSRLDGYTRSTHPVHLEEAIASLRANGNRSRWLSRGERPQHSTADAGTTTKNRVARWISNLDVSASGKAGAAALTVLRSTGPRHSPEAAEPAVQAAIAGALTALGDHDWPTAAEVEAQLVHRVSRQIVPDSALDKY